FVKNSSGMLAALPLDTGSAPTKNAVKKLYREKREALYEALMGASVVIPEGETDFEWIRLWQRVAEASDAVAQKIALSPLTILPTQDGAVVLTFEEASKFRHDALPIVDGDGPGADYLAGLQQLGTKPAKVVQYGADAAIECLSAWILEPSLKRPGPA